MNSDKGKPAKRQGRKAIGSKVPLHYDSLAAALYYAHNLPFLIGRFFVFLSKGTTTILVKFVAF